MNSTTPYIIVPTLLVLSVFICLEGHRLYKGNGEHSNLQRFLIMIKLGSLSYLKSIFLLACLIAPAAIMC